MDRAKITLALIALSLGLSACQKASMKSVQGSSNGSAPAAAAPGDTGAPPIDDSFDYDPNPGQQEYTPPPIDDTNYWVPAPPPKVEEVQCGEGCDGPKRVAIPEPEPDVEVVDECGEGHVACPKDAERLFCAQPAFQQKGAARKVDIVFVVDTSKSMRGGINGKPADGELYRLASDFQYLVSKFPADTDFNIGVLLGHGPGGNNFHGKLYSTGKGNDKAVLKMADAMKRNGNNVEKAKADLRDILKQKMLAVPNDSTDAQGEVMNLSLYRAVKSGELKNNSLAREGALMVVIYVSDEQDVCYDYTSGKATPVGPNGVKGQRDEHEVRAYNNLCKKAVDGTRLLTPGDVHGALKNLKGEGNLYITGAVYTGDVDATKRLGDENEMGHGMIEVMEWNGDSPIDLKQLVSGGTKSFAPILRKIGEVAAAKSRFTNVFYCDRAQVKPEDMSSIRLDVFVEGKIMVTFSSDCKDQKGCGGVYPLMTDIRANPSNGRVQMVAAIDNNTQQALANEIDNKSAAVQLSYMPKEYVEGGRTTPQAMTAATAQTAADQPAAQAQTAADDEEEEAPQSELNLAPMPKK